MGRDVTLSDELTDEEWLAEIERFGKREGFFRSLSQRHASVFVDRSHDTLLVDFDTITAARASNPTDLPQPLELAVEKSWSSLTFLSRTATWFRDEHVYAFLDDLVDECFFDEFAQVVFFGAGSGGYAACAFSVAAPGATIVAIAPQATLDPGVAEWDDRFITMRRTSFSDRYGYAPDMLEAAERAFIIYDPQVELDAMHVALFRFENVSTIRFRHSGPGIARELMGMGALGDILERAGTGSLRDLDIFRALRRRRTYQPYLRSLLGRVHAEERHLLTILLCRAVLRERSAPRFQHHLELAEKKLLSAGRALPKERGPRLRPVFEV